MLEKEMFTLEKAKQTVLQHLPAPFRHVVKSLEVVIILVLMLKTHTHESVVQACDNCIILIHTSKGQQINFKFLFIQFRLVR